MNGELAQLISLVTFGNTYLRGIVQNAPELFPSHSTFKYVSDVKFQGELPKFRIFKKNIVSINSTSSWFESIRKSNATQIGLVVLDIKHKVPNHIAVAFANSTTWGLQVNTNSSTQFWIPFWKVGNRNDPNSRIWSIEYKMQSQPQNILPIPPISAMKNNLRNAMNDSLEFCVKAKLIQWQDWFSQAERELNNVNSPFPYHPDLVPENILLQEARSLLVGACKSWVFGGMGSWNDMYFESPEFQKEYQVITEKLYQSVCNAILAGTNSTAA
jgi:hypothetical protein